MIAMVQVARYRDVPFGSYQRAHSQTSSIGGTLIIDALSND